MNQFAHEPEEKQVHLSHYWVILLRRWKLGLAVVVIVLLASVGAHFFTTPLYRSSILLHIERDVTSQSWEDLWRLPSQQEYLQTQIQLLKSKGTGRRVAEDLELVASPAPGTTESDREAALNAKAAQIASGISIDTVENTSLVRVSYVGTDPKQVQDIANGIGESFIQANIERKSERVRQATRFLRQEIEKLQDEIDVGERQVQQYGASRDIFSEQGGNLVLNRLESLNQQYLQAQSQRIAAESNYQTIRQSSSDSMPQIASDPVISGLRADLNRLERELEQKRANFLPAHPEMQRLQNEIAGARVSLSTAMKERLGGLREEARRDYEEALGRERQIERELEEQKNRALELNIDAVDYLAQRTNLSSKKELLNELTARLNETEVNTRLEGVDSSNIHIIEGATQPGAPYNANLQAKMKNAIPLGLVMALGAIFFLEYMDRSIKSADELEQVTSLPTLGIIPSASDKAGAASHGYIYGGKKPENKTEALAGNDDSAVALLAHTHPRSPITETYRAFRTSTLLSSAAKLHSVLVTSSVPREGKSTTAVNLAIVLSQMNKPVVVVDADLRKPRIRQILGGSKAQGLVDYLAHQAEASEIVESSEIPNLSFISSGPIPPNPAELLASSRMKELLEELSARYEYVVVDSPPLMAVTDAVILGNQVDGVILCVHGGRTPREVVQKAAALLRQAGVRTLGTLLNNVAERHTRGRYSSHYYEYYSEDSARG